MIKFLAHETGVPHTEPATDSTAMWVAVAVLAMLTVAALWLNSRSK